MRQRNWKKPVLCAAIAAVILLSGGGSAHAQVMLGRRVLPADVPDTARGDRSGLHIPQGKAVNFDYTLNDGAGYMWNIQSYGSVGSGTNNIYSGGMYLHVNGNNMMSRGQAWANEAGDEIELGPMPARGNVQGSLVVYRRVKVYKDAGLARWLDIFQNTGGGAVTFTARLYSNFNWQIGRALTNSGAAVVGDKDWAFITETMAGIGNNVPSVLHVFGDKRSKLRPRVTLQNNNLYLDYSLTVPAGGTVLLCHFESQNTNVEALTRDMQNLKAYKLLRDLPGRVRALIANFTTGGGLPDVDLERSESADTVILADEDPIYGTIQNGAYAVQTLLGALSLPAEKVIGMAAAPGEEDVVRFVLTDGEVISGRSPGTLITLSLPSGGKLDIPLSKVKSWAYRISKKHPEEATPSGPVVVLRTADQLAFDPAATKLTLRTRYGPVELKAEELQEVVLDNSSNGVHRAVFVNGSRLAGILEPDKISLSLRLGQKLDVPRDMITRIRFATEEKADDGLCQVVLSNDDELWGVLVDPNLTVVTQFGTVPVTPNHVKTFSFSCSQPGRAALFLWDGTVLRGQLRQEDLTFRLLPGPELKVPVSQVTSISRSSMMVSEEDRKKVERLVAQLGAESFKDRQKATEELVKMGQVIVPLLQKYLSDSDPEVRQRIGEVIEGLTARPAPPVRMPMPFMMEN